MSRRDWATMVRGTWLGNSNKRQRIDRRVREWLGGHRGLSRDRLEDVVAFTVERAYSDVMALAQTNSWLLCTIALALTGELVLCAKANISISEILKTYDPDIDDGAWLDVATMNLIRNVMCHPANPPVPDLCAHIKNYEPERAEFARRVETEWALVGSREFSEYVLLKLDAVGEHVIKRYRL